MIHRAVPGSPRGRWLECQSCPSPSWPWPGNVPRTSRPRCGVANSAHSDGGERVLEGVVQRGWRACSGWCRKTRPSRSHAELLTVTVDLPKHVVGTRLCPGGACSVVRTPALTAAVPAAAVKCPAFVKTCSEGWAVRIGGSRICARPAAVSGAVLLPSIAAFNRLVHFLADGRDCWEVRGSVGRVQCGRPLRADDGHGTG
jgi:hypothetical protein